jgi:hypothetical protein
MESHAKVVDSENADLITQDVNGKYENQPLLPLWILLLPLGGLHQVSVFQRSVGNPMSPTLAYEFTFPIDDHPPVDNH